MRILGYVSSATAMIIFFAVVMFVAGAIVAAMTAMGIDVPFPKDLIIYVMLIAGATFVLLAIFDYSYRVIEGEEQ